MTGAEWMRRYRAEHPEYRKREAERERERKRKKRAHRPAPGPKCAFCNKRKPVATIPRLIPTDRGFEPVTALICGQCQ